MPKRKGGRKKRGGSKQNPLANPGNVHNPKNFGSDQGLISGCAGCVGGNVAIGSGCTLTSQAALDVHSQAKQLHKHLPHVESVD